MVKSLLKGDALAPDNQSAKSSSNGDPRGVTLLTRDDLRSRGIRYTNPILLERERRELFPRRVYLSPAKVAWVEAGVDAWLDGLVAARTSSRAEGRQ